MYSMKDMEPISGVQGPIAGPINRELIDKMYKENIPVAYNSGNKYVRQSDTTISISWDIHI